MSTNTSILDKDSGGKMGRIGAGATIIQCTVPYNFFLRTAGNSGWLIGLGNRDECLVLFLFFDYFLSLCLKYGFSDLYSLPLRKIPWFLGPFHAHTCSYSFSHITIY